MSYFNFEILNICRNIQEVNIYIIYYIYKRKKRIDEKE